ncbi:Beta carbonic anhydrase 1 [Armadillidium vulgare]|nr:Beta carbonic anhydrase 1 [Armadillidium vulgare]
MDSRMLPTRFTQTNVGDMFIVRNAGNLVPHSTLCGYEEITTEPAALELGCVINGIKHVIVCGHSDCKLELGNFKAPLVFQGETPMRRFVAYIDPDNKFCDEDKLSQVNALQQLQNIASYNFMRDGLSRGRVYIHALWFDIYTGDIYYLVDNKKCLWR